MQVATEEEKGNKVWNIRYDLKEVYGSFFNGTTFVQLQEIKDFAFGHDDDDHKYGQLQFLAMAL